MIYSKGISWIDDTRIPFVEDENIKSPLQDGNVFNKDYDIKYKGDFTINEQGRFTPNLLVSDDALNDGTFNKGGTVKPHKKTTNTTFLKSEGITSYFKGDNGSNSRYYDIDLWFSEMIKKIT